MFSEGRVTFLLSSDFLVCDADDGLLVCDDCEDDLVCVDDLLVSEEDLRVCAAASDINAVNAMIESIAAIVFLTDPII